MDPASHVNEAETTDTSLEPDEGFVPQRKAKNKSSVLISKKTTSWEVYNILLRKLVDQLIDLGASKKIKIVAFQLWASYLRVSGAAFVSKDEKVFPALSSLGFRDKDVETLYGIKNLRKKIFTGKRKRNNSNSSSEKSENIENDVKPKERNSTDSIIAKERSVTDEQFDNQFKRKKGIVFKSSVSKELKEISAKMNLKTRNRIRRVAYDRRFHNKSEKSPSSTVTIVTLISIIRIALLIVGDEIYLSDILRWMCEGRISFKQQHEKILSYNLNIQYHLKKIKWPAFMMDIRNFTRSLKLKRIPTPNLFHLAERYCEELNLPNQFLQVVLKLMVVSNVAMDYSKYDFKVFPDYECRVMAFIIFTFKLTCSLDDVTEHHLSEFAELVHDVRSADDDPASDKANIFSWRKWMQFIECRKAVLSMHHVPTNNLSYDNGVSKSNIFFDYWDKVNSPYQSRDRNIDPDTLSSLKKECRYFLRVSEENENIDKESVNFPVSLTPFKSYTEHLMANHRKLLPRESRKILSADFSADIVNMAGNSQWYLDISEQVGVKIRVVDPARYFDNETVVIKNSSLLALSKTSVPRADTLVPVLIEDEERPEMTSNSETIIASQREIYESESDVQRGSRSLKVFRDLRYWCFHECHRKMAVEEFDQLAIDYLPSSFLWLLSELACMLRATPKELYLELVFVEIMLSRLYPEKFQRHDTLRINEIEW